MDYGAVILAGGKSSRMGTPKAGLRLNGVRFLDKLAYELSGFQELLVSVDDKRRHPEIEYPMVSDVISGCGPMGGLYAALKACKSDALVVVPCDVPLFSKTLAGQLCACLEKETDAVVTVTKDGRQHPLCGVYKKSCLDILEHCLKQQDYRMRNALAELKVKACQAGADSWRLRNVNTPQEFQEMRGYHTNGAVKHCTDNGVLADTTVQGRKAPALLAISGWKNSGKTTLIEKLIPMLVQNGLKVATVKHDGHSYEPDVPGTDSFRFFQAGAHVSVVYDQSKYSLTRRMGITDEDVAGLVPDADMILLEGFKWTDYPKIEVVRKENGKTPIPDLKGRIAYVSDMGLDTGLPVLKPDDIKGIAAFIMETYYGDGGRSARKMEDQIKDERK